MQERRIKQLRRIKTSNTSRTYDDPKSDPSSPTTLRNGKESASCPRREAVVEHSPLPPLPPRLPLLLFLHLLSFHSSETPLDLSPLLNLGGEGTLDGFQLALPVDLQLSKLGCESSDLLDQAGVGDGEVRLVIFGRSGVETAPLL